MDPAHFSGIESNDLQDHLRSLVETPRESLAVELKSWLDPAAPESIAKIVRAVLALRNHDGGFLIIGFDDSMQPLPVPPGFDVSTAYHQDAIQGVVSRYSSILFEVSVHFIQTHNGTYPVIRVPSGVTCPVACKATLTLSGKPLLTESHIYVRTLRSNGTPSTAQANWRDMEALVSRCFENRESDAARLLSKMLRNLTPEAGKSVAHSLAALGEQIVNSGLTPEEILEYGSRRFDVVAAERMMALENMGFLDIALRLIGDVPAKSPNREFLQLLRSANPDLTGWPIWLVSDGFRDGASQPYLYEDRWEAFLYSAPYGDIGGWGHLDYMIFDPKGAFFLRRAIQDDMNNARDGHTVGETIEPIIQLLRIAESFVVGQAFAKAMGCNDATILQYVFRWKGLKDRQLSHWANPMWSFYFNGSSHQNEAAGKISIPLLADEELIAERTKDAIGFLTRPFGGYEFPERTVRHFVTKLLTRKL